MKSLSELYIRDFNLWCEDTLHKIKMQDYDCIDWENLREEVAGLAGRDRRELKARLIALWEHQLKRQYVKLPKNYRGWEITIKRTQEVIDLILEDSPSLKAFCEDNNQECYDRARKRVLEEYPDLNLELPEVCT